MTQVKSVKHKNNLVLSNPLTEIKMKPDSKTFGIDYILSKNIQRN